MMTQEEVIHALKEIKHYIESDNASLDCRKAVAGLNFSISALRPFSREQVERMRGEWIVKHDKYNEITITECSKCGDVTVYEFFFEENDSNFCPHCGAPMTDEAVEILVKRMEEMRND